MFPILQEAPSFSSPNKRLTETLTPTTHHHPPPLSHNSGLTHQRTLLWRFRFHCLCPSSHSYTQKFLSCRTINHYKTKAAEEGSFS